MCESMFLLNEADAAWSETGAERCRQGPGIPGSARPRRPRYRGVARAEGGTESYHDLIPVGSGLHVLANRKTRIEPDRNGQPLIEEARCRDAESRQDRSTIGGSLQKTTASQPKTLLRGLAGLVRFEISPPPLPLSTTKSAIDLLAPVLLCQCVPYLRAAGVSSQACRFCPSLASENRVYRPAPAIDVR